MIGTMGTAGLCIGSTNVSAASYDDMKTEVETNGALVYNPISDRIMSNDESKEYVNFIEENKTKIYAVSDSQNLYDAAYLAVGSEGKTVSNSDIIDDSLQPQLYGASIPTNFYYLNSIYESSSFSGSGWRYSEYRFRFHNYGANPYFGVRAIADSFNFVLSRNTNNSQVGSYVVPASGSYVYYGSSGLNGYFSTYNPIRGSRYYIQ
ncbi:hypothetical protein D358_00341 [Enterococcus faecalis RP2S-4]|uniref:Uncharacterized protein n=2 Tax=Enterococcus faecalis TaxID=1351 RepID=A0ABC9TMZ2_ENTFL|nr:hypothetical protein D358_00341 [Enterococcus faecalis RP2S-4]